MKITKSNFGWMFTCFGLLVLLGIAIYLGASGWFFKTDISYTTDLELGKTVSTSIKKNQAQSISLTFDGSYLAGERLPQIVSIKNNDEEANIYIRAKVYVYNGENVTLDMDILETVNWVYNQDDGYYYYNDVLIPGDKATLCSYVIIGENSNFSGHKKYILTILFEALSENEYVVNLWGTNPLQNI